MPHNIGLMDVLRDSFLSDNDSAFSSLPMTRHTMRYALDQSRRVCRRERMTETVSIANVGHRNRHAAAIIIAVLAVVFLVQSSWSAARHSLTYDETVT
jgi:hypothetical protein